MVILEWRNVNRRGGDSFTIVLAFVLIYVIVPSLGMHGLLGFYGADLRTGNYFFDKVFTNLNAVDSLLVFLLVVLFLFGFYLSAGFRRVGRLRRGGERRELKPKDGIIFLGICSVFLMCAKFFWDLGDNFLERYANLILFRNLDALSDRNFFSANAFSLTQTLTWLTAGIFYMYLANDHKVKAFGCFVVMLCSAFMMGSRRGLIFPVLIIYFSSVLYRNDLQLRKLLIFVPLAVLWVGFGKDLTGAVAYDVDSSVVFGRYDAVASLLLRALADIGISQIQSYAVLQHFDVSPRLGIDHLLSFLRRFPDGMLGLDIDWPERIVRITTKTFASTNDADIPPGLIGQSWLDLPVIGSLLWGVAIGCQCHLLDRWASTVAHTPSRVVFTTLLALVIALPINSGSYDFTLSVDIIFLVFLLLSFFRVKKFAQYPKIEASSGR